MRNINVKFLGDGTREEIVALFPYADNSEDDSGERPVTALLDINPNGQPLDVLLASRCVGNVPRDIDTKKLWRSIESAALEALMVVGDSYSSRIWFIVAWDDVKEEVFDGFAATIH